VFLSGQGKNKVKIYQFRDVPFLMRKIDKVSQEFTGPPESRWAGYFGLQPLSSLSRRFAYRGGTLENFRAFVELMEPGKVVGGVTVIFFGPPSPPSLCAEDNLSAAPEWIPDFQSAPCSWEGGQTPAPSAVGSKAQPFPMGY
jgi:hypothetical protein